MKKLSPYCVSPRPENACAITQVGDCSIDCEGDTVWMCPHYIIRAIRELDLYPWWRQIYIKYVYNK